MLLLMMLGCEEEKLPEEVDYTPIACELLAGELTEIQGVLDAEEAAQTLIVPSENEAWLVKNEETEGYITIEVEDWMGTLYLFANDGIELQVDGLEEQEAQAKSDGCSGFTELRYSIYAWGSYVLRYQGEGDVRLSVIHP